LENQWTEKEGKKKKSTDISFAKLGGGKKGGEKFQGGRKGKVWRKSAPNPGGKGRSWLHAARKRKVKYLFIKGAEPHWGGVGAGGGSAHTSRKRGGLNLTVKGVRGASEASKKCASIAFQISRGWDAGERKDGVMKGEKGIRVMEQKKAFQSAKKKEGPGGRVKEE